MNKEFIVKKITDKIEIADMEVNSDPCKAYWTEKHQSERYDCMYDCGWFGNSPEGSTRY